MMSSKWSCALRSVSPRRRPLFSKKKSPRTVLPKNMPQQREHTYNRASRKVLGVPLSGARRALLGGNPRMTDDDVLRYLPQNGLTRPPYFLRPPPGCWLSSDSIGRQKHKTPALAGVSVDFWMSLEVLKLANGGGRSLHRTALWATFPQTGKFSGNSASSSYLFSSNSPVSPAFQTI